MSAIVGPYDLLRTEIVPLVEPFVPLNDSAASVTT
jgi:hypothetical protein